MAWLSTIILLTTSTASTSGETAHEVIQKLRAERPELFVVPELPPWPTGLRKAVRTPRDGVCLQNGEQLGIGTWLPDDLGRATQERLLAFEAYPQRAQAIIDGLVPRVSVAIANRVSAEYQGYSFQTVLVWALVGLAVGAAGTAVVVIAN